MGSALKFLFESEASDRISRFLRSRGPRARIIAPVWVRERVMAEAPPEEPEQQASWSETPGMPAPQTDGIWNYIVLARDAERERILLEELELHKGVKVYGLFRDVLPALLCGANSLPRGRALKDVKRYAILCLPRSGSRYLASMLNRHGLGTPLEHLREPLAAVIVEGKFGFGTAFEALERFGQRNGIFGTKLISTFLIKASKGRLSELEDNIDCLASRGYQFVHLDRPLTEAMISSYIAARLNKWHFFEDIDDATRNHLDGMAFDETAAWNEYIRFRAQKFVVGHIVRKFGFLTFSYEEVQSDVGRIVDHVCRSLEVETTNLQSGSASVPVPTRHELRTYETFTGALAELLDRRSRDIAPYTIGQIRSLVGIDQKAAERIAGEKEFASTS